MKTLADLLNSTDSTRSERLSARDAFLREREDIWEVIQEGKFPSNYTSAHGRKFSGAPAKTAIRCDFLLASKIALGPKYRTDRIADQAQRDLLFYVLRDREMFPQRNATKFYCCPKCTSKLHECVTAKVFRYIDNAKWKAAIESREPAR